MILRPSWRAPHGSVMTCTDGQIHVLWPDEEKNDYPAVVWASREDDSQARFPVRFGTKCEVKTVCDHRSSSMEAFAKSIDVENSLSPWTRFFGGITVCSSAKPRSSLASQEFQTLRTAGSLGRPQCFLLQKKWRHGGFGLGRSNAVFFLC